MNIKEALKQRLEILSEEKKDKDYKLSLVQQATEMGIPYQTFNKYVKGTAECSIGNLVKIARYYDVSTDYLLGLTKVKSNNPHTQDICKYTGLSEKAAYTIRLCNIKTTTFNDSIVGEFREIDALNYLLESELFDIFINNLSCVYRYCDFMARNDSTDKDNENLDMLSFSEQLDRYCAENKCQVVDIIEMAEIKLYHAQQVIQVIFDDLIKKCVDEE